MAEQWKRVYVDGKGYRYTNGKEYRLTNPNSVATAKKIARAAYGAPQAAADTLNRFGIGTGGVNRSSNSKENKETEGEKKPPKKDLRIKAKKGGVEGTMIKGKPETWKANSSASGSKNPPAKVQPTKPPISAAEQKTTTTRPPAAKPESKKPAPGYQKNESGYYRGTDSESRSKYEAELAKKSGSTSGNPLLDRFRRDMGRDAKTGERQYSTPEDKSKYVDKNGKLKIKDTPAAASTSNSNTSTKKVGGDNAGTFEKTKQSVEQATNATPFATRNVVGGNPPKNTVWDPKLKRYVKKGSSSIG